MPVDPMKDDELLGYFLIHCETDLALFHKDHYAQLRKLAGEPVTDTNNFNEFFAVRPPEAKDLVKKARERMKAPPPMPVGWDEDPLSCP